MQAERFLPRVTLLSYILGTCVVRADPNNFLGGVNRCARAGVSNPYSDSITTETPRASEVMKSDSGNDFVRGPITALALRRNIGCACAR